MAEELTAEAERFKALFGKSSVLEPKLRNSLRRKMRNALNPVVEEVRTEAMKPGRSTGASSRHKRRGLRSAIASGISVQVSANGKYFAGLSIVQRRRTVKAKLGATGEGMAVRWNAKRGWRHPVFPDKGKVKGSWSGGWESQKGRQFFGVKIIERRRVMRQAALDAMAEAEQNLNL